MHSILIVDDDREFLDMTRVVLEKSGFEVRTSQTPEDGLEQIEKDRPDLVILDVMMPSDYEGFDVARRVREDLRLRELPLVILTNIHSTKKVPYRFAPDEDYLPVDRFFDKPVEPGLLLDTINELLGEHREEPRHQL